MTRSRALSLHNRNASKAAAGASGASTSPPAQIDPKSAHTADPFLQSFLSPAFDAAEYLNSTLPPLQGSSSSSTFRAANNVPTSKKAVPLAELSSEAQAVVTQLNAHTTRLTTTLSQLTEDILRSGSRLAYEVELLRGETLGLSETLLRGEGGPLRADLDRFVPRAATSTRRASLVGTPRDGLGLVESPVPFTPAVAGDEDEQEGKGAAAEAARSDDEPSYITHLRTLTLVRARLDAVIKTFGEAMEFVFPPSEISVSSGFLSVSAPDYPVRNSSNSAAEQVSVEDRGQQTLKKLREEIAALLRAGKSSEEKVQGVEEATRRVEEIKTLSSVWKGTAEEKGRMRFVETLAKMVEDRHREVVKEMEGQRDREQGRRGQDGKTGAGSRREQTGSAEVAATESRGPLGGYGFMNQWQKIRGGL
ncbi:unnamed protein product [Discula destructiva]